MLTVTFLNSRVGPCEACVSWSVGVIKQRSGQDTYAQEVEVHDGDRVRTFWRIGGDGDRLSSIIKLLVGRK